MMTSAMKDILFATRMLTAVKIYEIERLIARAQAQTGEDGMTADFVWGNCSLQELETALNESEETETR